MRTQETQGTNRTPDTLPPRPPRIEVQTVPRTRWGVVILVAALASAITAVVTLVVMRSPMIPQAIQAAFAGGVEVPALVGRSFDEGRALLDRKGLVAIMQRERADTRVADGTIVEQSPVAGWYARRGVEVQLTVARGPVTVKVPDVIGLPSAQAAERLAAARLQLGDPIETPSRFVPSGLAVGTLPATGVDIAPGTLVHVVVSSGPPPVEIAVPKVTGLSRWRALATLAKAGLEVERVVWVDSEDLDAGLVARQEPAAGIAVPPGSTVTLAVVRGE